MRGSGFDIHYNPSARTCGSTSRAFATVTILKISSVKSSSGQIIESTEEEIFTSLSFNTEKWITYKILSFYQVLLRFFGKEWNRLYGKSVFRSF